MGKPTLRPLASVWRFYRDGFRAMTWGRTLWLLVGIKLAVIFVVLRFLFFRPALGGVAPEARPAAVADSLGARAATGP